MNRRTIRRQALLALASASLLMTLLPPAEAAAPAVHQMNVNGAPMTYVDAGRGTPVVFVPAALGDYRTWDSQRAGLAGHFRTVAVSQRYFGTRPWRKDWPAFGAQTHADDLVAFLRQLKAGPVHLVGWSYSGPVVLLVAMSHPELVKSAFVYEPGLAGTVSDEAAQKALGDDAAAAFGATAEAAKTGKAADAARLLLDGVADRQGVLATWPPAVQRVVLDNARTVAPMLTAAAPPALGCASLGAIKPPVAIVSGEKSRPFFHLADEAAAKCMPQAEHIVASGGDHLWPGESPRAFSDTLLAFIRRH